MAQQNDKRFYHPITIFNGLSKLVGAAVGLIYFPLTIPFINAAANMHRLQKSNHKLWEEYKPDKRDSAVHYVSAAIMVAGNSALQFSLLMLKFPFNVVGGIFRGIKFGFKRGPLSTLIQPSHTFNRYFTDGKLLEKTTQFRSQHLLALTLVLTVVISAVVTTLVFFFPALFAPIAMLTKLTGLSLTKLLGVKATGYVLPLLNFASMIILTLPALFTIESIAFSLVYLGKAIGEFALGIISPKSQAYNGNRLSFAAGRIVALINKTLAIIVGMPLYIVFKPIYQLFDSVRSIYKSAKNLWKSGSARAQKKNTYTKEWLYKFGVALSIIGNTVARVLYLPLQITMSLLYAPLQCVRHATKYGTLHVLAYPYKYANNYRGELTQNGRNYDKIHVLKYDNVYYFRKKHIAIVAVIVGLTLVGLSSFLPPLGYISINLTLKALTPLGLAQYTVAGTAVLIVNFLTGVVGTSAVAIAATASAWCLAKVSLGLSSIKQLFSTSKHFNNVLHKSVSAGTALRTLK
ncbi:MAG: hypothetical protein M3R00_09545, partial [Pseudomonadota bacterium]|nr:hypothetical protein [Pseudomonadota bacterium]